MAGTDLQIGDDGDYIDDDQGGFAESKSAQPQIRHQMLDDLGAWIGDPDAGRDRRLEGRQNTLAESELEADSVQNALDVLEGEGLIEDIDILIDRDPQGRFVLAITSRDTGSGETISFDNLQSFGV